MAEKKKGFDLAAALGPVPNLGTDTADREQLKYIPLGLLHPDPDNFYRLDGLEELAGNIELIGLQQPLRVRPDPEHEGEYIVVSGHRRRAAIELLVSEGKEAFGQVPCLIDGHQESEAMQKLRLIFANSSTRRLTSAELSQQAVDVEKLLYQLQAEGTEFPGRMRDHVADVCQTTKSKLARLKVIREQLIKELKKEWESGKLKESVAYAFAKNSPEVQRATARYMKDRLHSNCEYWHEANVTYITEKIAKELKPKKGPRGTCESCDHTESRLLRMAGKSMYDDHCNNGKCCHDCPNLGTCPYACPHLSGEVAKAREVAKAKQAKEKERKDKKNEGILAPKIRLWKRFGEARAAAGLTFEEYAKKADVRAFRREKRVKDFEQGRKLTPSSGGLPYAGGDGVDEWRIRPLIKAADALGCSVDYLLCRTDNPTMLSVEPITVTGPATDKPQWIPGDQRPQQDGYYLIKIQLENENALTLTGYYNKYEAKWEHPSDGEQIQYPVIGWYPIPQDEED